MKRKTETKKETKHKMVTAEEKKDIIGIFIKNHKNDSIM